jgi:hypothetical protein
MRTLILRMEKMVNALKKNPIQRHSSNYYTSMSHFYGFHFMPYLGRRPSCSGQDIITILLSFSFKCFDDRSWEIGVNSNRHKTPFGNTKEENGLQCIAPF